MDTFVEQVVEKRKGAKEWAIIGGLVLALLVVCHAGLYLRTQSDLAGGSLSVYSRESNRWEDILSELPLDTAMRITKQNLNPFFSTQVLLIRFLYA